MTADMATDPATGFPLPTALFAQEVAAHRERLLSAALRMTRNRADAEDLVQETLTRALAASGRAQPHGNLQGWLHRILTNAFISNYRKRRLEPERLHVDDITSMWLIGAQAHTSTGLRSAESEALDHLLDPTLTAAIRALPDNSRIAIYLADVEGLTCREISEIMGAPVGTVKSRLHRGHDRLRTRLGPTRHDQT